MGFSPTSLPLEYIFDNFFIHFMYVLPMFKYVRHIYVWCSLKSVKGKDFLQLEFPDGCDLTCGCFESNLDSLQEKHMLLTADPPLQPNLEKSFIQYVLFFLLHPQVQRKPTS